MRFRYQRKSYQSMLLANWLPTTKATPSENSSASRSTTDKERTFPLMCLGSEDNFPPVCKESGMKVGFYERKWGLRRKSETLVWQGDNLLPWTKAQCTNSFWVAGDPNSDGGCECNHPPPRETDPAFWNQAGLLISSAKWLWRDPFV